jgi:hypothetical protein
MNMNRMMPQLGLFVVLLATSLPPLQKGPDLSTPKSAIHSFINALNQQDFVTASRCVLDAHQDVDLAELQKLSKLPFRDVSNPTVVIDVVEINEQGDAATVECTVSARVFGNMEVPNSNSQKDKVTLSRQEGLWKIVAPTEQQMASVYDDPQRIAEIGAIASLAAIVRHPRAAVRARYAGMENECIKRMKLLCLYALGRAMDQNGRFKLSPTSFKASLMPTYMEWTRAADTKAEKAGLPGAAMMARRHAEELKIGLIFHCPIDSRSELSYSFNGYLENVSDLMVADPANTVLFYEGKDGKLTFRHDNKACVGFANSDVRMVNATDAKRLLWRPFPSFKPKAMKANKR